MGTIVAGAAASSGAGVAGVAGVADVAGGAGGAIAVTNTVAAAWAGGLMLRGELGEVGRDGVVKKTSLVVRRGRSLLRVGGAEADAHATWHLLCSQPRDVAKRCRLPALPALGHKGRHVAQVGGPRAELRHVEAVRMELGGCGPRRREVLEERVVIALPALVSQRLMC